MLAEVQSYLATAALGFVALNGGAVLIALAAKGPALTKKGLEWLDAHILLMKSEHARSLLSRTFNVVAAEVLNLEQTEMPVIKADLATGQISKAKAIQLAKDLKDTAVSNIKKTLTAQGLLTDLKYIVFSNDDSNLDTYLGKQTEVAVQALPPSGLQTGPLVKDPVATAVAKDAGPISGSAETVTATATVTTTPAPAPVPPEASPKTA